jgi:predicted metal-dependent hydrolase
MRLDPAHRGAAVLREDILYVGLPAQSGAEQLRDLVQGWLQGQARVHFAQRLEHYRQAHDLAPTRWRLSSARTRWGSCGSDGAIRLNWRLMHFPPDIIDYVICHELAHLRELNHGPQFWHAVQDLFPDYERARGWLRGQTEHATD